MSGTDRDLSPNSVILTFDSNLHTSSSSSDHSHESRIIQLKQQCLDLDHRETNKTSAVDKSDKDKVQSEDSDNGDVVHYQSCDDHFNDFKSLDSARSSFSLALKECQERRLRSEALARKLERRRPASLDLNSRSNSNNSSTNSSAVNVVSSSPRLVAMMKKNNTTTRKSGNFPSPGTPNYRGIGSNVVNKGWSSERVAMPTNGNRRQVGASLLPLNNNGRVLPSKWEDAERWIFSPVAADSGGGGSGRPSSCQQQQVVRRPKAKSGPLGTPGLAYHSMYSPALPMYEGSNMAGSPFSAGVMVAEGWSFRVGDEGGRTFGNSVEPCIARSVSVHGCTDLVCQTSLTSSQDENNDVKDGANSVSRTVSRRDMATQMSPEGSCHSSPRRLSNSPWTPSTPSSLPIVEVQSYCSSSSKREVRDVQIDERVTVTRWSKKHKVRVPGKASEDVDEWKLKAIEPRSSAWDMSDSVKSLSKSRREEAKIAAWENLQRAKAEAAIRKLEMKLEKKRSSSIDKIMKKLRSAQKKAQKMRSAMLPSQALQVSKTNNDAMSLPRTRQMSSLSGCFTCHAF